MSDKESQQVLAQKNKKTVLVVFSVVFAMVGLAFASVPLYSLFCRVTGWGGTTQVAESLPAEDKILEREMTVRFDTNTARDLPWDFEPEKLSETIKIGERGFINFISQNNAEHPITGTAVFNVTPLKAGKYFQKVQCFCFGEQTLQPGEKVNMPVLFFVDPAIDEDRGLEDVKVITLSYSFYKTDTEELDIAVDEFYNR